jgi:NAD(P)-dependent dehydrogenase (short-subunit alcohol dehydrogenase family)
LQTAPDVELGEVSGAYAPTKTYLNAVTIQYAKELSGTNILINNACPGYVTTELTGFQGFRTPKQGAVTAIRLATLPDDGPSGSCSTTTVPSRGDRAPSGLTPAARSRPPCRPNSRVTHACV